MGTRGPLTAGAIALAITACAVRGGVGRFGVRADVAGPPHAVPAAGETPDGSLAVYEVEVRNDGESAVRIERLVRRRSDRTAVDEISGTDLARRVVPRQRAQTLSDRLDVPAGGRAVVLLEAAFSGATPPTFEHDIDVSGPGERAVTVTEALTATELAAATGPPVVLGPPLAGGGWLMENGPATLSGHRRAVVWLRSRSRAAQRFAVDFFRVGPSGRTASGDGRSNDEHFAFGADVLAVADASVAAAQDGIPDNAPDPRERAVEMSNETVAGNHVVLDLGGGRFAMYAHLRQGSVRVRTGDRVRRGDVLGALGNSGNSTEPHLHLHVADGPSPVDATGLPFVLDAFASGGAQFAGVLPAEGAVIDFGAGAGRGRASHATNGVPTDSATK